MSTSEIFIEEFERLLERIPKDISFRQLQYDYRQVAFLMGMKVLERFPEVLVGRSPSQLKNEPAPGPGIGGHPVTPIQGAGPGQGLGPYPHELCTFTCVILSS